MDAWCQDRDRGGGRSELGVEVMEKSRNRCRIFNLSLPHFYVRPVHA